MTRTAYLHEQAEAKKQADSQVEHGTNLTLWNAAQLALAESGEEGMALSPLRKAVGLGVAKMEDFLAWAICQNCIG